MLEPEHFASPHLDELSGMTYLSYFMKVASRKILTSNFYMNLLGGGQPWLLLHPELGETPDPQRPH